MPDHSAASFTLSVSALLVLLLIFGMKYFSAARQAGGRAGLAALRAELGDVKIRLAAIEKMLNDVG